MPTKIAEFSVISVSSATGPSPLSCVTTTYD